MNKYLLKWGISGIFFVFLLGALLHFVFERSGNLPIVGAIASVNESVCEHFKQGFWLAVHHTARFRSFILGGTSPYRGEAEINLEGELVEVMKRLPNDPERDALLRDNDAQALIALVTAFGAMPLPTDHELSLISVPVLVFCGDADPRHSGANESASHMPKVKFVSLPGLDHVQADVCITRNDLVLSHVKEFLAKVRDI